MSEDTDDWAEAMAEQADAEATSAAQSDIETADSSMANSADPVQVADLDELSELGGEVYDKGKLDTILDIPVKISMEVGRTSISIRNLLQLNQGSVVELDRVAGESLDVLVNGTLIAHGEVVVVNDKFGIRLTDVISQIERIKKLK